MPKTLKKKKWQEKSIVLVSRGQLKEHSNCCLIKVPILPKNLSSLTLLDNCQTGYVQVKNDQYLYYVDKTKTPPILKKIESGYSIDEVTQCLPTDRPLMLQNELSRITYLTGHKRKSDIYFWIEGEDEQSVILPFNEDNVINIENFNTEPKSIVEKLNEAFKSACLCRADLEYLPNSTDRKKLLASLHSNVAGLITDLSILEKYGYKNKNLCDRSYWFGNHEDKYVYDLTKILENNLKDFQIKITHGLTILKPGDHFNGLEKQIKNYSKKIEHHEKHLKFCKNSENDDLLNELLFLEGEVDADFSNLTRLEDELNYWESRIIKENNDKTNPGDIAHKQFIFELIGLYERFTEKRAGLPTLVVSTGKYKGEFLSFYLSCKKILEDHGLFKKLSERKRVDNTTAEFVKAAINEWRKFKPKNLKLQE